MRKNEKRGRPEKPWGEGRNMLLRLRVTGEEFLAFNAAAGSARQTFSEWARDVLSKAAGL